MNLDREKAREALGHCDGCDRGSADDPDIGWCRQWQDRTLAVLEGCVVPDPRLARIAALFDDDTAHVGTLRGSIDGARGERVYAESTLRAVLGGGSA